MKTSFLVLALPLLLLAHEALADDAPPTEPDPAARIGVTANTGFASFQRSSTYPTSETGAFLGGEVRVHPLPMHGFVLGFTQAGGLFGPTVSIVDAAYSLRLQGPHRLRGVTGAVYLDFGPSAGFVYVHPDDPTHTVLGGRVSIGGDLQLANVILGTFVAYRGGTTFGAGDAWEGALTFGARVGVAFDVGQRP